MSVKQIQQYKDDIERYVNQVKHEGLSSIYMFDIIARSKPHAIAALGNTDALKITNEGVPLGHHIPYCWESIGILLINNEEYGQILNIESNSGDTTIHMLARNSSRARRAILESKKKNLLKTINKKTGVSVSHLLAYDDQAACYVINSDFCKKELLRREHINGSSVAHWIAKWSLKGSTALLNRVEYSSTENKNFFEYVLRQVDNYNDTVIDIMRKRWANNISLHPVLRQ